ncbi:MAG: hypothetical protein ACI9QL_004558 [Candidatus Omnitrophota bacterium]|jgi:hypothetical protein
MRTGVIRHGFQACPSFPLPSRRDEHCLVGYPGLKAGVEYHTPSGGGTRVRPLE